MRMSHTYDVIIVDCRIQMTPLIVSLVIMFRHDRMILSVDDIHSGMFEAVSQ